MKSLSSFFTRVWNSPGRTTVENKSPRPLRPDVTTQAYVKFGPRVARQLVRSARNKAPSSEGSSCPPRMSLGWS